MNYKILVVEDEEDIRNYIKDVLIDEGFLVHTANDGPQALALVERIMPDLVVLDLGLPKLSGEAVCTEIKKNYPHIAVVILTAKDKTRDVIEGFNIGADDYISKPFIGAELAVRIKARLKDNQADSKLKISDLVLDTSAFEVKRGSKDIELTPTEFRLLEYLMKNTGQVLSREMILNKIWQSSPDIETRVVDVYMGYLRKKIDENSEKKLIKSVRGFGYTLKE